MKTNLTNSITTFVHIYVRQFWSLATRLGFVVLLGMLFAFGFVSNAEAAFPVVQATSNGGNTTVGVSTAVTLPAGVSNGNLLMVFFIKDGTAAPTSITGTGWNSLGAGAGSAQYYVAYWKIADGSDTLTVNHASVKTAYAAYRITGHDPNTAPEVDTAQATNANPNPPAHNPVNWDIEDTLWISSFGWDRLGAAASNLSAYPTNYSGSQTSFVSGATANDVGMAVSTRNLQAASDDPGTATLSQSVPWIARTISVRPIPTLTLSGNLFTDAGITPESSVKTIAVAVGTSTPGRFSSTSVSSTGAWSVTLPAGHGVTAGTPIMIWVDGDSGFRATLVTKASSTDNISGLDLYEDRVIVRHEGTSATSTTNSDLGFYTAAQDSDLQHSTSSTGIVIHSPNQLYVWTGDTFAPGGNVTIAGNGGSGATEGSFFLATSSTYTAGGELRLAGSLSAISGVTFNNATGTLRFIATTTGKTINAPVTSLGNVTFDGVGGAWSFSGAATTSAFTILRGAVTAPATTLGVTGVFQNDATFNHNNGTLNLQGASSLALSDFSTYVAGRDASGSAAGASGSDITSMVFSDNSQTLYVAKIGDSTACSQTAGSAQGCELMVFNIASTTNPIYVAGRDSSGNAAGTAGTGIDTLKVVGNFLYVGKSGNATACSQTAGSAQGCELMVFNIASTTNPIYTAGRDLNGSSSGAYGGGSVTTINTAGNALYLTQTGGTTACSQAVGSAEGCELQVYDISSTTNPIYTAGRDVDGSTTGVTGGSMYAVVSGSVLYAGVISASAAACSQSAGSAGSCELQVYDISSTTNPIYTAGRDVDGSTTGATDSAFSVLEISGNSLFVLGGDTASTCGQTSGLAAGCILQVYDITNATNPVFVRGARASGEQIDVDNSYFNDIHIRNNYLYAVRGDYFNQRTTCSQEAGAALGCEIMIFDISSSTALRYIGGKDSTGSATGTSLYYTSSVTSIGNSLYVGVGSEPTACAQTAGAALGCEIQVYDISRPATGVVMGNLTGTNSLNNVNTSGVVQFRGSIEMHDLTINSGTTTASRLLTVGGDFTNNANFYANEGVLAMVSESSQTISGLLTGSNALYDLRIEGSGTKSVANQASTTKLSVMTGAVLETPSLISVTDTIENKGTLSTAEDTIITKGFINEFVAGVSAAGGGTTDRSGLSVDTLLQVGDMLYVGTGAENNACSQTAGSAEGCELKVFDISSTTNMVYVAGRDVSGNASGTGNAAVSALAASADGNFLFVGKSGVGSACSQTAGSATGCELMVFDISSTTNPVYVTGRDVSGSATGTGFGNMNDFDIRGNYLYIANGNGSGACSQTAGSASGCEMLVFDISSSTNPVYVAGRDKDGTPTGSNLGTSYALAIKDTTLYLGLFSAGTTACNTAALNCELQVFSIASGTNPIYVTGRDSSASAAGVTSQSIFTLTVSGDQLFAGKEADATACSQTAGSAVGCELQVYDISSTTNPVYAVGRDSSASSNGTDNTDINSLAAKGKLLFVGKSESITPCSQTVGLARGCELIVYDLSSTTNPSYVSGIDAGTSLINETSIGVENVYVTDNHIVIGKQGSSQGCEQQPGRRIGCEIVLLQSPTVLKGQLTGSNALSTLITNGMTSIRSGLASTTSVIIASSSTLVAPTSTLSIAGNLTVRGTFEHNNGQVSLLGTNQIITTFATTTFYDLVQIATTSATTTFSTNAPFVILRNLNLQGAATATPLRLQSAGTGTQWRIDPYSTTTATLLRLDVQDSNNISATATLLVCGAGCRDGGNNLNWALGLQYTLSGILYREDGVTPYATATPIRLVIPLSNTYFQTATSASTTGAYSMTVSESFLATSTPYFLFADNAVGIDANTVVKSSSTISSISGLDLYKDHVILRTEGGTSTPITNEDLALYNLTNDNDLRYTVDSGLGLRVALPNALVVWDNSSFAPEGSVVVSGVATTTATVGTLALRDGAVYTPLSRTTLAGSFRASTTSVYNPGLTVLEFNATTTGKTINSQLPTLGNVNFTGAGGAWSFTGANATTSDFIIDSGTVTAPSAVLTTTGLFTNNGTFSNNSGVVRSVGNTENDNTRAATFVTGHDGHARKTGGQSRDLNDIFVQDDLMFIVKNGHDIGCSAGSAGGCEIVIYNNASTTDPIALAGLDSDGSVAGLTTGIDANGVVASGNYLYVVKSASSTACSQAAGSAAGCELMVFDISSTTNPVYVAGRDSSGSATGTGNISITAVTIVGKYLYLTKAGDATACSQFAGTAIGCELMVFDISSPTNPVYVTGRDATGNSGGSGNLNFEQLTLDDVAPVIYIGKAGDATACSQTAGSAIGCELMVFNIASATNPIYVAGRDSNGASAGATTQDIRDLDARNGVLAISKTSSATACSQVAGSASGCELMLFDISSTTNPIFTSGRDASGDATGTGLLTSTAVKIVGNNLLFGTNAEPTACSQSAGSAIGCEIKLFDISSTTNPVYVAGRDASGNNSGTSTVAVLDFAEEDDVFYVGKQGDGTSCSQTPGLAWGCELMIFKSLQPAGKLGGSLIGANTLGTIETQNLVSFSNNASTTNIIIATSSVLTGPASLSLAGDFTNNGTFTRGGSDRIFAASSSVTQNFTGSASSSTTFGVMTFNGSGTKNLNTFITTSDIVINSGASVVASNVLAVMADFVNNGTLTNTSGELFFRPRLQESLAGRDSSGSAAGVGGIAINAMVSSGTLLYVAKSNDATACSQTAGSAIGCELMVFDVSSTTNPIYVAGRDSSGSNTGTGNQSINELSISGNALYATKVGSATACSQTAGSADGCEIIVFNISSSTNPTYVAGRDSSGSAAGVGTIGASSITISGNNLYIGKAGSATACSQTAGSADGCEIMVFDVSSTTNPVYVAGRDSSGSAAGVGAVTVPALSVQDNILYVAKNGNATACSQTAGSADGCEIMVFDISTSSSPTYLAGRDSSGGASATGSVSITSLNTARDNLYVAKLGDGTACSQTAGFADGCELMVFDMSTPASPNYAAGLDSSGSATVNTSTLIWSLTSSGDRLYIAKNGNTTPCAQVAGSAQGCELMEFDISSTTNPTFLTSRDGNGSFGGTTNGPILALAVGSNMLYLGKNANTDACSQAVGSALGCELQIYDIGSEVTGGFVGGSGLGTVRANGAVLLNSAASSTNLIIETNSTFVAPTSTLSISEDFSNYGQFRANEGTIALLGTDQTLISVGTTTFNNLIQVATTSATTTFSTTGGFETLRQLTLQGSASGTLKLRSTIDGTQWKISPQSTSTIAVGYVDVKDSRNVSQVVSPLNCDPFCTNSGNNTNWFFAIQYTISGTLYGEDGVTPYATATPIRLVVPLGAYYLQTATSAASTGVFNFPISDVYLATSTPYFLFTDNSVAIKANTIVKSSSTIASISGLDLYRNHVIVRSEAGTTSSVTNADLAKYTATDDVDIQYSIDNGATLRVSSPNALMIWNNTPYAPEGSVVVSGVASTTPTVGSLYLRDTAVYTPSIRTTLAGSFRASTTAVYNPGLTVLEFNATTTGKTINSQLPTLGNVNFTGAGGSWSFTQANATTSDFIIDRGTVTAPSGVLTATGVFRNTGTFSNNNATVKAVGNTVDDNARAATFIAGRDNTGALAGSQVQTIEALHVSGDYLYRALNARSAACTQSTGSGASGCEIAVFDVSSSTNPVYVAGRDSSGSAAGTAGDTDALGLVVTNNFLYVAKSGSSTPCSQTAGSANGCEIMVFDVTDPTDPIYVAGRDSSGSAAGTAGIAVNELTVVGDYLYAIKDGDATACSQVAGSAIGCELIVFDISSSTNPVYVAGRDVSGSSAGTGNLQMRSITTVNAPAIYIVKANDTTACSQTAGSAIGCELMVFNVASGTNPVYVAGRDSTGSATGAGNALIYDVEAARDVLAVAKAGSVTACSQVAGSADGCELMIFDISSTTNPVYVAGRDGSGSATGTDGRTSAAVDMIGNNLIFGKFSGAEDCTQVAGSALGCEIMIFDISSTTNPVYVAGRDSDGTPDGLSGRVTNDIVTKDSFFYVGKNGESTNCSESLNGNAIGCELMVFSSLQPAGILSGNLTATNALSTLESQNLVSFASNASTTNIAVATSSTLTGATNLSLSGNFTNAGTYIGPEGSTFLASSSGTQNFTGTASSSTTFNTLTFGAAGTKNLNLNATATDFMVSSGVTVTYANDLSINRDYTNNGTVNAGASSELILTGENIIGNYIAGRDSNASATGTRVAFYSDMVRAGEVLYISSDDNTTACTQVAGSAQGCELQVYDISSTTNPVYVAGRDSSGTAAGTSNVSHIKFTVSGNTLFTVRFGSSTPCSQVAGSAQGCELQVYDISSTTNPIYVAGRDVSGSASGVASMNMVDVIVHDNFLYTAVNSSTTAACTQVAGTAEGCELQIYDISNPQNPIYVAGRDVTGNSDGAFDGAIRNLAATSSWLYVGKASNSSACTQVAGTAEGCELQVYDISNRANPIYVAGRDASGDGSATGTEDFWVEVSDNVLFVSKTFEATPCSQVAGLAEGCELMVFDISSSSNPIYIAGRDASGDATGTSSVRIESTLRQGDYLYAIKTATSTPCSQVAGLADGCELMVFDISSSSNPIYVAGQDSSGIANGTGGANMNHQEIVGSNLYVTKDDDATACSQTPGLAVGCELMVFTLGNRLRGNMTGTSAHQKVVVNGPTEWLNNASTTDIVITNSGLMNAPAEYSLTGDFTNNGAFYSREGTVTLIGTDQQLSSLGTTTFNNLVQVATTSATTTFSASGAFVSSGMLRLQGTSTARLKLRSTVDGTQWTVSPQGSSSVAWLDVQDSKNSSSTVIECSNNCINRGNTTNWIFFSPLGTGTSTLKAHAAGQVSNVFGIATSTDEELLAFQIETNSGSTTFSNLVFGLQGISGVNESDLTNFRLVQDRNSNRSYDAGDILVGGIGDVTWSGESAVVGFYEPFEATTTRNYVVVADVAPIANGSFLTIGIGPNGISAIDSTGAQTILGTTVSFQHSRNNRGAGGNSASIGGPAPAGDGDVGGGDTTGGELIGSDPDFFWPTSNSGSWINGAFAYDGIDGTYATTSSASNHNFTNHGFGIPGTNTIGGIEVKLELSGTTAAGSVDVQLSWDGGTSWTATQSTPTLTTSDVVRTLGSPSDLWGRTWTTDEFSNANFAVRLVGSPSSNTIRVDAIQVRVYHVTSGGGGGGGGGAI